MNKNKEMVLMFLQAILGSIQWSTDEQDELMQSINCRERLLGVKEAATLLEVSPSTINNMVKKGLLTRVSYGPKTNKYFIRELMQLKTQGFSKGVKL